VWKEHLLRREKEGRIWPLFVCTIVLSGPLLAVPERTAAKARAQRQRSPREWESIGETLVRPWGRTTAARQTAAEAAAASPRAAWTRAEEAATAAGAGDSDMGR